MVLKGRQYFLDKYSKDNVDFPFPCDKLCQPRKIISIKLQDDNMNHSSFDAYAHTGDSKEESNVGCAFLVYNQTESIDCK